MSCRSLYPGSIRRDQVKGQPRLSRKPARAHLEDSRCQIKRTLRMHQAGTAVLLAAISCASFIAAGGLVAAVLETMNSASVTTNDPLSELRTVLICLGGWLFCFHCLWRCYRTGLEDVRDLLRQLSQLEQIRHTLAAERRAIRKQQRLAVPLSRADATKASETSQEQARKLKRGRTRARTPRAGATGVDNVVQIENYRRV
jgi:hypothetical protein